MRRRRVTSPQGGLHHLASRNLEIETVSAVMVVQGVSIREGRKGGGGGRGGGGGGGHRARGGWAWRAVVRWVHEGGWGCGACDVVIRWGGGGGGLGERGRGERGTVLGGFGAFFRGAWWAL